MTDLTAILDADVLVPAALRDTLLRAASAGLYRVRWSSEILGEVERTLINRLDVPRDSVRWLLDQLRTHFDTAEVTGYESLIDTMTNDVKDRHVVAAAFVARADVIVTRNVRHFPDATLAPLGIRAERPDEFLSRLFDTNTETMVRVIEEQAAALRDPPLAVADILRRLERVAPAFAGRIRSGR